MSIPITASTIKPQDANVDLLIIPLTEDSELDKLIPETVRRRLGVLIRKVDFKGHWGSAETFVAPEEIKAKFIALVGIGNATHSVETQAEGFRRGVGRAMQDARKNLLRDVAFFIAGFDTAVSLTSAATEAVLLSDYRFTEYSTALAKDQEARSLKKLTFLVKKEVLPEVRDAFDEVVRIVKGVEVARNLVNQPASHMFPRTLMEEAKSISKQSTNVSLKVLDREQARREGMHAFLAVADGSETDPYFIHLTYSPKKKTKKIILVGKGVTFDSGGLSLKPANYMEDMKIDMAGAAAVLGLFSVISHLKLDIEVHGLIAACENMPSGTAYRPGDIVKAKNGKTIEILNTDAEGRVTLADALSYAVELKPDMIVDLATLTGAVMAGLGDTYAGLWANDEELATRLLEAAKISGEGLTQLPLPEEYRSSVKSSIADLRNTSTMGSLGGAITAALFLQEFIGDTRWAHLDIAGPVYAQKSSLPYYGHGATGYGVRTLVTFLQGFTEED